MKKWQFWKILARKLCVPILLTDAKAKYCYLLYPIVAVPKCLSYVHPLHRSNDGRITRLLGQWIDGGSMERSVYISCSHNAIHIKLWSFLSSGRSRGHSHQTILFRTSSQASVARPSLTRSNSVRSRWTMMAVWRISMIIYLVSIS